MREQHRRADGDKDSQRRRCALERKQDDAGEEDHGELADDHVPNIGAHQRSSASRPVRTKMPPSRNPVRSVSAGLCVRRVIVRYPKTRAAISKRDTQMRCTLVRHCRRSGPAIDGDLRQRLAPELEVEGHGHKGIDYHGDDEERGDERQQADHQLAAKVGLITRLESDRDQSR